MKTHNRRYSLWAITVAAAACATSWVGHGHANAPSGRYTIANGIVHDTKTKLSWERAISTSNFDWADAQTYCMMLNLEGNGWRLPSMKELQTIVDERRLSAAIDPAAFPTTPNELFWTSSPSDAYSYSAWYVDFDTGITSTRDKSYTQRVRCVRTTTE